jgi:hypothetical protein
MRFEHLLVSPHDPKLDYTAICDVLFDGRYLVTIEAKGRQSSPNVSIQGETDFSVTSFGDKMAELITRKHSKRDLPGFATCRPCKRMPKEVVDKGFQYVKKADGDAPLAIKGITPQELAAMRVESVVVDNEKKRAKDDDIRDRMLKKLIELDSKKPFREIRPVMKVIKKIYSGMARAEGAKLVGTAQIKAIVWTVARDFCHPAHRLYEEYEDLFADVY